MKTTTLTTSLLLTSILITSCGPSAEEIKAREKAVADSIAQIYEEKARQEEEERKIAEEEERKRQEEYNNRPEVIRQKLLEKEQENPLDYLTAKYNLDYRVFSGDDVIEGRIYNNATLATYKDIKLEITCYSKTKSLIKTYHKTIYEYVYPRKTRSFTVQLKSPSGTKTIGVNIISAAVN